jgi:hypothetical protein
MNDASLQMLATGYARTPELQASQPLRTEGGRYALQLQK